MTLPDCMMPDGADPCVGYKRLRDELDYVRDERDMYRRAVDEKCRVLEATEARMMEVVNEIANFKMAQPPAMLMSKQDCALTDEIKRLAIENGRLRALVPSNAFQWQERALLAEKDAEQAEKRIGVFRLLVAACARLSNEAEEYDFDDGMGRGAMLDYWYEFDMALERAKEVLE